MTDDRTHRLDGQEPAIHRGIVGGVSIRDLALGAFAVAAIAVAVWVLWRPASPAASVVVRKAPTAAEMRARYKQETGIAANLPTASTAGADEAAIAAVLLASPRIVSENVSREKVEALARSLAAHAVARSTGDPDDYIRLASRECAVWLPKSEASRWAMLAEVYKDIAGREIDQSRPMPEIIRPLIEHLDVKKRGQWAAIGTAEGGASMHLAIARVADAFELNAVDVEHAIPRWYGSGTCVPYTFRSPPRSLREVLIKHRSTPIAGVRMLVETVAGVRYPLDTQWFWDPECGSWQLYSMGARCWDEAPAMY